MHLEVQTHRHLIRRADDLQGLAVRSEELHRGEARLAGTWSAFGLREIDDRGVRLGRFLEQPEQVPII